MGNWTILNQGDDKNGKRKRTTLTTVTQAIHIIPTTFYAREKCTTQQSHFLRSKKRKRRISSRCMETNLRCGKNCEFEAITAAELLTSKFLSLIGKSTGDYELKKSEKTDISVETITDTLHEYMYEKLNDSPETEEEKKICHLNKRKTRTNKETGDKPAKFKKIDCIRCGAPNWSRQRECPARGKKCAKCGKIGHFAKCCRSNKKIYHIQDEETSSAEEDEWAPDTIHSMKQKIPSTQ